MSTLRTTSRVLSGTALTIIAFLLVLLIAIGGMFATGTIQRWTADWRGETDQIEKTEADSDYRIASYDQFYDLQARVTSLETQICTMRADTALPKDQRSTNVLALTNQRTELVNQYNADARKKDTRAKFRAWDLPHELPKDMPTC